MVKPGGRIYLSTPAGAFENGNVPGWAKVESKGHLRAMRPQDLCALLCELGVVEDFEIEQGLMVASLRPEPRKGKVIFYVGAADCLPEQILTEGLGGSETAVAKVAEHFARRGYDVRVYGALGGGLRGDQVSIEGTEPTNGQVLYAPEGDWDPGEECDLFVCSRIPEAFDRTISAPRRALWLHDADYGERLTSERAERATEILVMSEFQRELLVEKYPFIADRVQVTRNGIEAGWYEGELPEKKPWAVYSSSPDRGQDVLLECWPEIHKQVPDAELHLTYAPVYERFRQAYPHLQAFHRRLEKLREAPGVVVHGSMNQRDLAELFKQARVWSYPSFSTIGKEPFPEISCLSAMEAQAAGCACVHPNYGALVETVQPGAGPPSPLFEDGQITEEWRRNFVASAVEALSGFEPDPAAREWALEQDWAGVADQWERLFGLVVLEALAA